MTGTGDRRIHGAANAAARLSSTMASERTAAARSVSAAGPIGRGQGRSGIERNRIAAPYVEAAPAILRWYR